MFMLSKLRYDPVTKKKLKPIIKFNGGRGAILCHKCRVIVKENLTWDEIRGKTKVLFCNNCAMEMLKELFSTHK